MGIDIISWRIRIGVFSSKVAVANLTTTGVIKRTSSSHCDPLKLNRNVMIFLTVLAFTSLLVICMDIEVNPGPTSTPQFTSLFNTTKRIQLKLIRYQHHLKNYEFYATNDFVPQGLLPRCIPAFDSNNFWFNHKNYNFLDCDWFRKLLFPTNSLVKLLSDSLLSDTLLSDSLLSDSSISQSHSKLS